MWLLFLVLHLVGQVGFNLNLRKSLLANIDKWTLATIMQTGIAIPMIIMLLIAPPSLDLYDTGSLLQIGLISILVVCLHLTNVKALQYLEASVYSVLYNLRILFATALGIFFLNEEVVPLQILGGLLIFLAVVTIRQRGRKELTTLGVRWGIAAAIVISVLNLFEKQAIAEFGFLGYAVPVMLVSSLTMWVILWLRNQHIPLKTLKEPRMIELMTFRAFSAYGFTLAFNAGGLLSVSTYISSLSVVLIVALGVLLLKERDYLGHKILATGMAVFGLTLILIANL